MDLSTLGGGGSTSSMALDLSASAITWLAKEGSQNSPILPPNLVVNAGSITAFMKTDLLDVVIPEGFSALINMVYVTGMTGITTTLNLTIDGVARVNSRVMSATGNGWTLLGTGPNAAAAKQLNIENVLCRDRVTISATPEVNASQAGVQMTYILIKD
jgi:hypothetical protein